ncbi:MAG: hypothetical protein RBT49_17705 [Bacteroidales bacterium]|nr:hypothetical protein [Bacteroidales bacterium]
MKKSIFVFLLMIPITIYSQISIKEDVKTIPIPKPIAYDSLSNFKYNYINYSKVAMNPISENESIDRSDYELLQYIGQTLYFIPCSNCTDNNPMENLSFHYKTERHFGHDKKNKELTDVYKPKLRTDTPKGYTLYYTPNEEYRGKYFKIIDFEFGDRNISSKDNIKMFLENDTKDTIFVITSRKYWAWGRYPSFILLGYYEKQKQMLVGRNFIFNNKSTFSEVDIVDINTGEIIKLNKGDEWLCKSVDFLNTGIPYLQLYLVFSNISGNEIKVRIKKTSYDKTGIVELENFVEKQKYLEELELLKLNENEKKQKLELEENKKQLELKTWKENIINTYGEYYGNLIVEHKVLIGMNQDMCKEAWGEPFDKYTTIISGLKREQWVYSSRTYLYFDNEKLTGIQR